MRDRRKKITVPNAFSVALLLNSNLPNSWSIIEITRFTILSSTSNVENQ